MFGFLYLLALSLPAFLMALVSTFTSSDCRVTILLNSKSTNCPLDISTQMSHRQQILNVFKIQHMQSSLNTLLLLYCLYRWMVPPSAPPGFRSRNLLSSFPPLLPSFFSAPNQLRVPSFLHPRYLLNQSISLHFTETLHQANMVTSWQNLSNSLVS